MSNPTRHTGKLLSTLAILLLASACADSESDSESVYLPQPGDEAIVFTHRFNPGDYDAGRRLLVAEIGAAISGSGQTRRTYFLHSPDQSEFTAISFFHPDSSSEEWLANAEREQVMTKLRPLYREPLEVQIFVVDEVHDAN